MKKKLFIIALTILILCGCEEKKVTNILPEGEYDFVEETRNDGVKITRDDYEEEDIYTDGMIINIWQDNKATLGWIDDNKEIKKMDILVTGEYLVNKDDKEDKVKYKYSNNKIELYYENGNHEIYIKDYRKQLESKYQEMIGHYEITTWINDNGFDLNSNALSDDIVRKIKENTYIDVSNNKKATISFCDIGSNTILKKSKDLLRIDSKHLYNNYETIPYTYDNGKITLNTSVDGVNTTIVFQKTK